MRASSAFPLLESNVIWRRLVSSWNASFTGTKTVNGPRPARRALKPARLNEVANVDDVGLYAAVCTIERLPTVVVVAAVAGGADECVLFELHALALSAASASTTRTRRMRSCRSARRRP